MPILPIRRETYERLEKLALAKKLSPNSLLEGMLKSAEAQHEEMDNLIKIFEELCPEKCKVVSESGNENVVYGLEFGNNNVIQEP